MSPWIAILKRHKVVRASAAAIFLYGFAGAATSPYQSVIGIRELGLSDQSYAIIAFVASITNVIMAIAIGAMSDRFQNYRRPLIIVSGFGIIGYGLIWAVPSPLIFTLATVGPLALFHATNSMLFGNVRARSSSFQPEEAKIVNALMRMTISLSWVVVPGAIGLLLMGRESLIGAYLIAAIAAAICTITIILWLDPGPPQTKMPRQTGATPDNRSFEGGTGTANVAPSTGRSDRPVQVRLPRSVLKDMSQVFQPRLLTPVIGIALISQVLHVNGAVLPLILTGQAGGRSEDVGFVVGMVALLEVIFMFGWTWVLRHMHLMTALTIAVVIYLGYLIGLAVATSPTQIFVVSFLAGLGAAGIISIPISYLLDLITDRPGLSASLIAVNMFLGGAIGAGIFAIGTTIQGYPTAAVLSGFAGLAGAGTLIYRGRRLI